MGFRGLGGLNIERKDLRLEQSIRTCSPTVEVEAGLVFIVSRILHLDAQVVARFLHI